MKNNRAVIKFDLLSPSQLVLGNFYVKKNDT